MQQHRAHDPHVLRGRRLPAVRAHVPRTLQERGHVEAQEGGGQEPDRGEHREAAADVGRHRERRDAQARAQHQQVALLRLVHEMHFERAMLTVHGVFGLVMEVELHKVIAGAVHLHITTLPIGINLHRMAVVHDSWNKRHPVQFSPAELGFDRLRRLDIDG